MVALSADHLIKQFAEKTAVNDISFQANEGEFLVFVGPSGCGKTTTLRLLAGLEAATKGDIYFGEKRVTDIRPRDRNIGMVFQDYAVFPHLTVFENIAYGLRSRGGMSNQVIRQKVEEAARLFRIDPLLKRKPRQLSGGERQRVALSRALVRDADVYLYDEPLSNLDAQLRHQAREDILALHREKGRPSIYVTHDQSEAMSLGDRIAVMRNGRIEQIGTGSELYARPQNLFVAFFIGTPSMNLFDVTLRSEDERMWADGSAFSILLPAALYPKISDYVGEKVKFGFRPEDLHVPKRAPFEVNEDNTIRGVVNVIEPSSSGSSVYLTTLEEKGEDFIATFNLRLPATYIGKDIELSINTSKVHLFDLDTERSLTNS
jgi:multiple sugar transport system ATP-binding protein